MFQNILAAFAKSKVALPLNPLLSEGKSLLSSPPSTEDPKKEEAVSNKLRRDWNDYVAWLEKKGMKGKPELDKSDLGGKMIDQYRKEFPQTSVSRETVIPIQREFRKYRDWTLNEIKNKRAMISDAKGTRFPEPNENLDHYMKDLSIEDGIAGQRTTSFRFPDHYIKLKDPQGNVIKTENLGFAKAGK